MADAPTLSLVVDGDRPEPRLIKRRFQVLNNERVARVRDCLQAEQRVFVDLLPLLFHINDPLLPGYVKKAPAGIADFSVSKRAQEAATRLVRKFSYRRRAMRVYHIQALYLMGSTGTVAYSEKSDFDIWVCHHPELSNAQLDALRNKAERIGSWARSLGLDVKFFLMNPECFRRGETQALSEDSSGSAQHRLLLEEFYRTGLLMAGRYPAWWLVAPENEDRYEEVLAALEQSGQARPHEYVDFGNLSAVPAEEFFGAALWQLNKAIDSPYKSVLKLLLMESYTSEYPSPDLLCRRFKQAVYAGQSDVDQLDPYVLMVRKVEEYLAARGEDERRELARKCFYFKVGVRLSAQRPRLSERRVALMDQLIEDWGWGQEQLLVLDSRATWKIHRVLEERTLLVDELTRSYRNVSDFARQHAQGANINSTDLNLLGRRLYAAFERKVGKVEIINPGISTDLTEQRLSFVRTTDGEHESWLLYRGDYDEAVARGTPTLRRGQGLIELVAWCHFNRLIGPQTLVTLHGAEEGLSVRELLALIDSFRRLFPDGALPDTDMASLRQPARVHACGLYINLGLDPLLSHTRRGVHLTSNRSDALSYGGFWKNLALTFDLIVITSWREVLTFHYQGETALLDCLCDYLAWAPIDEPAPLSPPVFSFSSARGMAIAHRVEELFRDTIQCFYRSQHCHATRYVLRVEHNYHLLQAENGVPRYRRIGPPDQLLQALGEAQQHFSPVVIDRYASDSPLLSGLLQRNRPDVVQVFFQVNGALADVYILDEKGSLFFQSTPFHSTATLSSQYQRFLDSAIRRCNATERAPDDAHISPQVEFYRVLRDASGQIYTEALSQRSLQTGSDYLSVQVMGAQTGHDATVYSLFCQGHEFSSLEFGEDVFRRVAQYILDHREDEQRYPIYITDADVNRTLLGADGNAGLQTVHYLNYKKAIEQRLNAALASL